jgi:thioesterase domain-containing protein
VTCYIPLARATGRRVLAFEAAGLRGDGEPLDSIEGMADRYIDVLLGRQPSGPYVLGGWSLGGCVALEMGRRLRARGGDVALVVLIDSHHPSLSTTRDGRARVRRALLGEARDPARQPSATIGGVDSDDRAVALDLFLRELASQRGITGAAVAAIHDELEAIVKPWTERRFAIAARALKGLDRVGLLAGVSEQDTARLLAVFHANVTAHRRYSPPPYDGNVVLLRGTDALADEEDLGWRQTARGLHVERLPGDHLSIVRPPCVEPLATRLSWHIESALTSRRHASAG